MRGLLHQTELSRTHFKLVHFLFLELSLYSHGFNKLTMVLLFLRIDQLVVSIIPWLICRCVSPQFFHFSCLLIADFRLICCFDQLRIGPCFLDVLSFLEVSLLINYTDFLSRDNVLNLGVS